MLSKAQKLWLWIFGAMFVVPEVLWSPIVNFVYSIFSHPIGGSSQILRSNFLFSYQSGGLLKLIILIQFIGAVLFFVFWIKNKKAISSKSIFWSILLISSLILLVTFFVSGFALTFNPTFPL